MAKFRCPILTCNVEDSGTLWNMAPMAVMHMKGSHQMDMTEEDIAEIVAWQADPLTGNKPWPKIYPEAREELPRKKVKSKSTVKDWWNKING